MKKSHKILIGIFGILIVVGFVLGAVVFMRDIQKPQNKILPEIVDRFRNELIARGVERDGHPIERFDALLLMRAFPGLREADFDSVETYEGEYAYDKEELKFQRNVSGSVSTIEKTVSNEGYETLLENLSKRLGMSVSSMEAAIDLIDAIDIPSDLAGHIASKRDLVVVHDPRPLFAITSPLTVRGQARGTWYFEGTFPIMLVDWDGKIIAQSYASALLNPNDPTSTWMTEDFVPFEGTIEFQDPSWDADFSRRGTLIFQKDNPSGLPEYDDALEIPILFKQLKPITSFEACADAGYPIMESYPEQCRTPDGRLFVKNLADGTSGVKGTILLGPTCPVMREPPEPECSDKPIQGAFIVQNVIGSAEYARFRTDTNGRFLVHLPAGEYSIIWENPLGPGIQGHLVNVIAGETSEYTITFDTGIR
ncbi:MAG: hypothetical protein A3C80_01490 [Candidatus Ryanbacteria bacterium RIFCSPHIGHO2_02_FULL_45_43]|uniref:Bacterial spore germination immunoglobulin-like domain-containing protein n=1 Tax=Candidatus Ryanbacteria bacterium RIFCSPHIGHO2_01_45_13 TaxID=1802112 RepID=A0A1G2FYJ3_9BACT|nr:MAG: hypothetical protein A2718_02325 [Candidatus Ryanbacteria bacterium RIFCSPHIGHO2_01_FULL_44_130]OGZ42917.1 MAG: hypothetical protein A2W41_02265 [Candidatus Ryanbacteria bacterium RIFCSPHIGHO2_01_45_13]OGZ48622.1 MAG: hypothetical protein A3C80_01490 [Candidatus Ryanbacteria bacterium RIFCSPHIGHO2_02_FULL_45_43]OGZ50563.1 MAG: hypothetical protein A3E55_02970 [Candidatus Ryanbacteria bacterium RIFCSPHIGHO2_12_FULL_44_20]OGZ51869.1 MAG: hypothetical protein A3A17_00345 [Candidatus Ryanba